jgi:hypothetical protein
MSPNVTERKLTEVREQLEKREPIFHRAEFGTTRRDFENMTDAGFWEVGASGRRYSRDYVIDLLVERHSAPVDDVWETSDFRCLVLGPDTYLLTYTLVQSRTRVTRRATIWRNTREGWKSLYHQGTMVEP